ncbi:proline-rich receptor-like protein kinase PERK2 [Iris pallida]|uniref:Proline-rich receptor-like protein kinase PERK2 n=1 Tax=Iris pallida TaxID=29817 RepID=A0AAX6G3N1_IRIPA|nr:proline-rich receptor-like protein kinase PERK2 [Iris pallida]KAJ6802363.1 proline-rich receptor-like protein kinase PERK2 [Iris pallida]KAJ6815736.1 proline-rich receptor-like protein kinase PERK2 [Iris pallida]KAJ6822975.1 proline-rich receptor-like protein kinase PERK2 [Iris pallida]KAJ6822976.1 proline-rich receptor-like protein kinase PERK2 [Iris pallida]
MAAAVLSRHRSDDRRGPVRCDPSALTGERVSVRRPGGGPLPTASSPGATLQIDLSRPTSMHDHQQRTCLDGNPLHLLHLSQVSRFASIELVSGVPLWTPIYGAPLWRAPCRHFDRRR